MNRFEKAADFGKSMGTAAGALLGAGIGGGGTALYDWIRGNKQNRLRRALIGAGIGGGLGGAGGFIAGAVNDNKREAFNKEYDARQAMQKADREERWRAYDSRMKKLKAESEAAHKKEIEKLNEEHNALLRAESDEARARRGAWKSDNHGFKMEDFLFRSSPDSPDWLKSWTSKGGKPFESVEKYVSERGMDLNSEEWARLWATVNQYASDVVNQRRTNYLYKD